MQLSNRLERIIELAGTGKVAADIGCDHGYTAIELVRRGRYARAIASDVRKGPLAAARTHIRDAGLSDRIDTRLGDGLAEIRPGEADAVVIAGMGGSLMAEILKRGHEAAAAAQRLILSPQSEIDKFRRFLMEEGFRITEEAMAEDDGKTYVILVCRPGREEMWSGDELRYGRYLLRAKDPLLMRQLAGEIRLKEELLPRLQAQGGNRAEARRQEISRELAAAKRIWETLEGKSNV